MVFECTNSRDSWTSMTNAVIMESSQAATDDEFFMEYAVNLLQHKAAQKGNCINNTLKVKRIR